MFTIDKSQFDITEGKILNHFIEYAMDKLDKQRYSKIVPRYKRTKLYYAIMKPYGVDRWSLIRSHLNTTGYGLCAISKRYFMDNNNFIDHILFRDGERNTNCLLVHSGKLRKLSWLLS